jgi:ribonuclease J
MANIKEFRKRNVNGVLKVIPVGGLEEVGRNMMILEYDRDIIIIDMGVQFPEEDTPGIDFIIPNVAYLKGKEQFIRGVLITHGHLDHIGAIPYLMPRIGNPAIFSAPLGAAMIQRRQDEFRGVPKLNLHTFTDRDILQLGVFKVEFFRVNHNIPDSVGIVIHTPVGSIMHTGDFKFDHSPVGEKPADIAKIARFGADGILLLCADSTSCETPGHAISEKEIGQTLAKIVHDAKGRVIVGTFSSLLTRIQQLIWICERLGKKLVIEGYSMKANVEIAKELGYLKYNESTILTYRQAQDLPSNRIVIACTGAQGEDNAALMRIANREHREIQIRKGDSIIFSSSVIPGNERSVQGLKDTLTREGADIFHYKMMDVHSGGHACAEDLKLLVRLVKPTYYLPIHGNRYMLKINGDIAIKAGVRPENVFVCDNGQVVEVDSNKRAVLTKKHIPSDYVMVDGLGVHDSSNVVLRDRQMLAEDGMLVVILTIDPKTGEMVNQPDIISRGFVHLKENKKLIDATKKKVYAIMKKQTKKASANDAYIRNKIRDELGQFLFQKTQKRPMVLPVIIEV